MILESQHAVMSQAPATSMLLMLHGSEWITKQCLSNAKSSRAWLSKSVSKTENCASDGACMNRGRRQHTCHSFLLGTAMIYDNMLFIRAYMIVFS